MGLEDKPLGTSFIWKCGNSSGGTNILLFTKIGGPLVGGQTRWIGLNPTFYNTDKLWIISIDRRKITLVYIK